ncbi:MAG: hypothetical protein MSA13_00405, partial [Prevotella sp.]|nr:hypothetical protein [Prevotella sp.]
CRTMQAIKLKQGKLRSNRFSRKKRVKNEEIITKTVKKLTNYLHNQEKVTIFAGDFKQVK